MTGRPRRFGAISPQASIRAASLRQPTMGREPATVRSIGRQRLFARRCSRRSKQHEVDRRL